MKRTTTRLSSVGPALPPNTGLLLGLLLSPLLSLPRTAGAQTLPSQVGVDIVFPRDDTYAPADPLPIVFAFSGASAAWTYGFDFAWRTRRADGCQGQCGVVWSGQLSVEEGMFDGGVSFGGDDAYYLTTSARGIMGPAAQVDYEGGYTLEWEFGFQRNCSTDGGTLQSTGGVVSASGTARFVVRRDASINTQQVRAQLEDECPLVGGVVGILEDLNGCPRLGGEATADPCALDVPDDVVNYVVSALAATGGSAPAPVLTTITSSSLASAPSTSGMLLTSTMTTESTGTGTNTLPSTTSSESLRSTTTTTTDNKPGETGNTSPAGTPGKSSSSSSYGSSTNTTTAAVGLSTGAMTATISSSAPNSTFPTVNAAPRLAGVLFLDFSTTVVVCFFLLLWGCLWFV